MDAHTTVRLFGSSDTETLMMFGNVFDEDNVGMLPPDQVRILDYIILGTGSLGLLGASFIMITFLLFKDIRMFSTKLIFFLSLSDFMVSISWFPFGNVNEYLCTIQAMGLQFFLCSSLLWTMCISLSLAFAFYSDKFENFELSHNMKYYHFLCWGYPTVTVFISLLSNRFADIGPWCFLVPHTYFRLFYYLPLAVVFFVNLGVLVAVRLKISRHKGSIEARMNVIVSFYLVGFLASQLPSLVNGMQNFFQPENPVFVLYLFQSLFQPMQGFLNCLVYGKNEGFVEYYIRFFEKYFFRCRKGEDYEQEGVDTGNLLEEYNYHSDDE